tara:strand:+ start:2801 stop:3082 length:282 start_codon:yes stop_codon:yes gene_type:complete
MPKAKETDDTALEELKKQVKELTARIVVCEGEAKPKKKKSDKPRTPSKYALFIKEKYAEVKKENPAAGMGEISKIISKMWKENKISETSRLDQ